MKKADLNFTFDNYMRYQNLSNPFYALEFLFQVKEIQLSLFR